MSQKTIKSVLFALLGVGLAVSQLQAAITINIAAEKLKDSGGYDMAVTGILVLVADASRNGFAGPTDSTLVQGDDVMVGIWDIATAGGNTPGAFSGTTGSVNFSGDWDQGDPLAIYWFPTLSAASPIENTTSAAAIPYGMFRIMADSYTLSGPMDVMQAESNPDNVGSGTGTISGDYDTITNTLNYSITFQDLSGAPTNMHFHVGAVGVSGGVDLGIPSPWVSPKVGNGIIVTDEHEANLTSGLWYVNIHTAAFTGGEVRGQVILTENAGELPDGSDGWVTPEDGTIGHNLFFITTDATVLDPNGGSSDPEDGIAGEFTPGTRPLAPSNVAGAAQGPAVNVTWTDNATDETGYRVERSVSGSNNWSILATTAAGVSMYLDTSAAAGTTYLYRVLALRGPSQSVYAVSAEVDGPALSARFSNLSNRALVGVGDEVLIGSFILSDAPLRIYARVGGPAISNSVANFLADPQLELYRIVGGGQPNVLVAENDSWKSDQQALIESTTIEPANDVEPALVATLEPGTYSVVVKGVGDTTGFANVEIYEFRDPGETTHGLLTNLSNRALVGVGDEVLIGSVIITGDAPQRIYARVGGPAISNSVANFLADPTMELFKIVGGGQPNELIAQNDSWKSDQQALIESTTIEPANDVEPAIVATLDPGTYSIVVKGVNDTTGFANVELYNFPE